MEKLEEFTPFLIGIKLLPGLALDSIQKEMKGILEKTEGYKVPPESIGDVGIKIGLPIEPIGLKEDVEIKINLQYGAFNIIGDEPEKVNPIFEEFNDLLPQLPYDIEGLVDFYEIIANVGIKTETSPRETLDKLYNIDLASINEINPNISLVGIRIGSLPTKLDQNDFFDIIIEPKKGSYSNRYYAQLRYQTNDKNNIAKFEVKSIITQLIEFLERE